MALEFHQIADPSLLPSSMLTDGDHPPSYMSRKHPCPQQFDMPQVAGPPAGHEGCKLAVWAAGTLNFLVSFSRPQEGQTGFSSPRTRTSNSWPQSRQAYS